MVASIAADHLRLSFPAYAEVPAKQETAADLQAAEALLARCGPAMTLQNEKAERAASVARDVERLLERQTQRQLSTSSQLRR